MTRQADFIKESTTTVGTGNITLVPITGFGRFSSAFAVGDIVPYYIENGNNKEVGLGIIGVSNTLVRNTVLSTIFAGTYNNTNPTAISLSGTSYVGCGPIAVSTQAIRTNIAATCTVLVTDSTIIQTTVASVYTLPAAASIRGKKYTIVTKFDGTVTSASSNIVPLAGGSAGTAILDATAGKWATIQSDGTNWQIIAAN